MSERDRRLVEEAGEMERGTREHDIGPTDHDDEDVEVILEREDDWPDE